MACRTEESFRLLAADLAFEIAPRYELRATQPRPLVTDWDTAVKVSFWKCRVAQDQTVSLAAGGLNNSFRCHRPFDSRHGDCPLDRQVLVVGQFRTQTGCDLTDFKVNRRCWLPACVWLPTLALRPFGLPAKTVVRCRSNRLSASAFSRR